MIKSNNYCASSCLAFRYIASPDYCWENSFAPVFDLPKQSDLISVCNESEVDAFLNDEIAELIKNRSTGIFFSGGIDSAILASYCPAGTKAYSIKFMAENAIDETITARLFAEEYGLDLTVIEVFWEDFILYTDILMGHKKSILHPVEIALYKASIQARKDGLEQVIVGNGADSTFGGLDKLLSRDWTLEEFINRYSFLNPNDVLKEPVSMRSIFEAYLDENGVVDTSNFLKYVHGYGVIQAFNNSIKLAGLSIAEPYEKLLLGVPLDLERIRNGESKYFLRELFKRRFPNIEIPEKIAFARPMDVWLKDWESPKSKIFKKFDLDILTGDQKWLVYCLDRYFQINGF